MSIVSVHPAMINRFRQQISAADEDDINALDGWDSFEPDEKKFLAVFGWFGQKNLAAEYIGRSAQWVDRHQRQNPLFKEAIKSRDGMQTRIARNYGADLLGKAMLRLDAMLDEGGADNRTQLDAIKTILKMNHIEGKSADNSPTLENNFANITVTGLPGIEDKPIAKAVNPPNLEYMK